ncbi:MAG: hypothetical protein HKN44_01070 [Ilumatobacter sp.]|nr:hypothetical protein [Ilumatobacter sp.]
MTLSTRQCGEKGDGMRRAVLNTYIDLLGQADVLHAIRETPRRHVAFLGAGVSREADVPLAGEICDEIRDKLTADRNVDDIEAWAEETLSWNDSTRKYTACLDAYGSAEVRVAYFRQLLKGARPAFAHHAISLLMARDVLFRTALTTNFDKLLEQSFVEQGTTECQAIRTPEEAEYWDEEPDKCFVMKLHGDYDTHNILNTRPETRSVPGFFGPHIANFLRAKGMLVLGSAANEESIIEFVKTILTSTDPRVLSLGVRWGVFVGPLRPNDLTAAEEIDRLQAAIEGGAVSKQLVELLADMNNQFGDKRPCSFFPIWGSGNFLLRVIETSGDDSMGRSAQLFLDHEMRLHATFHKQDFDPDVIETHIRKLQDAQRKLGLQADQPDKGARNVLRASADDGREIRVAYGDITSSSMIGDTEFATTRTAVISPEDTTISAGGGVALRLLTKAGPRFLLNELSKLGPIDQGSCAVTSAGNLPIHYVFHAAALQIGRSGEYEITPHDVRCSVSDALRCAEALRVGALWIPLLGAGVATVPQEESFKAIVSAIAESETTLERQVLTVVIFDETMVSPSQAYRTMQDALGPDFTVSEI